MWGEDGKTLKIQEARNLSHSFKTENMVLPGGNKC